MSQDNYSVAIMNMVNELASRYGVKPYEFVAVVDTNPGRHADVEVRYESPVPENKETAFARMLIDLGIPNVMESDDAPRLVGSEEAVYNALEAALQRAPRKGRGR